MARSPTAKDYMTTEVVSVTPDTDIHQAMRLLLRERISGAPVIDGTGDLVGVLSLKDCLRIAYSTSYHKDHGGPVSDFMSAGAETIDADTDIVEVAEIFLNSRFHRYPVVADGRMVGLISRYDVLKALEELW